MFDVQVDVIDTIKKGFDLIFKVTDEKMVRLCRNGELKRIKQALQIIRFQADVNAKDDKGITALMEASRRGYLFTVEALIRAGADVNATTHSGWTALMQAVKFSHPQTTQAIPRNRTFPKNQTEMGKSLPLRQNYSGYSRGD